MREIPNHARSKQSKVDYRNNRGPSYPQQTSEVIWCDQLHPMKAKTGVTSQIIRVNQTDEPRSRTTGLMEPLYGTEFLYRVVMHYIIAFNYQKNVFHFIRLWNIEFQKTNFTQPYCAYRWENIYAALLLLSSDEKGLYLYQIYLDLLTSLSSITM